MSCRTVSEVGRSAAVAGRVAAVLLLSLALLPSACHAPSTDGAVTNTVRAQLKHDPNSLSLIGKRDRGSEIIGRLVSDSLVQYDAGMAIRPSLAESWQVSDDGLTVTFQLRRGVRWHDGAPVTARDVVFTIDKVLDPATEATRYLALFDNLADVEALDRYTVRARYTVAHPDFLEGWWVPILPEHIAGRDEDLLTGEFSRHPIGCGPFRFVEHKPGQRLVLEANKDYWDGPPSIDGLVFEIFPDDRTAYQALLIGAIDLMNVTPDLWRESRDAPRDPPLGRFVFYRNTVWYIGWNQDGSNPFFGDPRVRRAMTLSLDRESLSERLFAGLALPGATSYHPHSPWANPEIQPRPFDPEGARLLLAEAGWTDSDGDGVRDRDGVPFSFTLLIIASTQEIVDRMAAWIQQSLAQVGLRMEIEKLEFRAFQERRRNHRFEAAMASLGFSPIPDQFELYHSTARGSAYNYVGLDDPEVDRLSDEGRRTFDERARLEIYYRLQRRLYDLEPLACLFHFATPVLHDARLGGVEPSPLDYWRITPGPRAWYWTGSSSE